MPFHSHQVSGKKSLSVASKEMGNQVFLYMAGIWVSDQFGDFDSIFLLL